MICIGLQKQLKSCCGDRKVKNKKSIYERFIKRPLDMVVSFLAIILLSPVFLLVAIMVKINLGSPVIFKQQRVGLNENVFVMYKFRTMTEERNENGELLPDDERITQFGKFLRSTSLDELPELFNIFKGDMSFVGPRPLLVQYLPLYNKHQRRRHEVRPGLTGLAQINGRNAINWEQRFKFDVQYADNITFLNDLKILFLTFKVVFKREGINSKTSATMEPFKGNQKEGMGF